MSVIDILTELDSNTTISTRITMSPAMMHSSNSTPSSSMPCFRLHLDLPPLFNSV
ncbi:glycosyltransferase family 1 protein [Sesbania bispinosa]|nr:glycosyltransferase family 1 protein [Sesbania bispinosa]